MTRCSAVTVGAVGWLALVVAVGSMAAESGGIWVHIANPRASQAVIGEIEIEAQVVAYARVRDVAFFVDGRPVGMVSSAPYRLRIDLGEKNQRHEIEVVATDVDGREARHRISTLPVEIGTEYEVGLRQLYVTVLQDDEPVVGLGREVFTVLDNGEPQKLVTFAAGNVPFTAALLIDTSESMVGTKLAAARDGALAFIDGMRDLDQATAITFSDTIREVTPFTNDREILAAGLVGNRGEGGTAVHDAVYVALKRLELQQGRRVVVVLSDGIDSHSGLSGADLLEHVRMSRAMVYWIRLVDGGDDAPGSVRLASSWRAPKEYRRNLAALEEIVELTGGKVFTLNSADEIQLVFVEILNELRRQYALGYYPSDRRGDGSWHRVRVRVARARVVVRAHEGYLDLERP
ncbi:MAG: VWA domain-containing protein [Holophagae bacterium]